MNSAKEKTFMHHLDEEIGSAPGTVKKINFLVEKITEWGEKNYRDFPWRNPETDYESAIAEIMLQRTKADQVFPVYAEFLKEYPDFESLASAKVEMVRKYFKKLGLLWRANIAVQMAKHTVKYHNGRLPDKIDELLKIPGMGPYSARAVMCFYFGKRIPIIDSNVIRLYSRYFGISKNGELRRNNEILDFAGRILPEKGCREFNYYLLDFGDAVCRPDIPRCRKCILTNYCQFAGKRGIKL